MDSSHRSGLAKILIIFLVLSTGTFGNRRAESFQGRDVYQFSASFVNLFLLGLVGWEAAGAEPMPSHAPFEPNFNLSPDSTEAIFLEKIADGFLDLPHHRGIRTLPNRLYGDLLRRAMDDESFMASDTFARSALEYLREHEEEWRRRWGNPYFRPRVHASYHFLSSPNRAVPGVTGSVNPFLTQREGHFSEEGHNAWVGAAARGGLAPWMSYELDARALFSSRAAGTQDHAEFFLHRGYVKGSIRDLDIEVGKDTVQWGLGRYGSMLFSGNAESFYLFRVANSRPVTLPWFLHHLGPTRVDFFFTFLDGNRTFPHSILHGMKTTFKPHRRVEFGLGQTLQFGGEGSGSWNPLNYFAEALTGEGNVDHNFVLEARWRIPRLEIEPYVELFWEDCCKDVAVINPRDTLNLAGIYFPNIGAGGRVDFAFEWVRTNRIAYRHANYASGFFYKSHGIGHPIGPDGSGFYGILRYFHSPTFWLKTVAAFEQRGRQDSVSPEDRYRIHFHLNHEIHGHVRLKWEAGYEHARRFDFTFNTNRHNVIAGAALELF